jgi:hypothetical protein
VGQVQLDNNNLDGSLPPELGNLPELGGLFLKSNQYLTGPIPPELGNLTNLQFLDLSNSHLGSGWPYGLSGPIPPELGNLTDLTYLDISNSKFYGPLPTELTNLTQLETFRFYNNNLCEPADAAFQTWLGGIPNMWGTGITCAAHTISGQIVDDHGVPVPGVTVNAAAGGTVLIWQSTATTDVSGAYTLTNLITETYTIVPAHANYIFTPTMRIAVVPPSATAQDFTGVKLTLDFRTAGLAGQPLQPGSTVIVDGANFPPNSLVTLYANGDHVLGTVTTDGSGAFAFILDTSQADMGSYVITARVNPEARFQFMLAENGALVQEEDVALTTFQVPAGIALHLVYLPLVLR